MNLLGQLNLASVEKSLLADVEVRHVPVVIVTAQSSHSLTACASSHTRTAIVQSKGLDPGTLPPGLGRRKAKFVEEGSVALNCGAQESVE